MTTTTHAPGPWAIEAPPITLPSAGWIIQDAIGNDVCEGVTTEANARLIAKAPELLAALKAYIAFTSYVVSKRGSCVTAQHLALDDEDMAHATDMLKAGRALLTEIDQ